MSEQFVYFIQADEAGPIKIGFTADDPKRRLSQLQTGNPHALKLLGAIKGSPAVERKFHADLAEWRLQGEWFKPHESVLAAINLALEAPSEAPLCDGSHCSFCGTCNHSTGILIAGPGEIFICEQCVGLCANIVAEHFAKMAGHIQAVSAPRKAECEQ